MTLAEQIQAAQDNVQLAASKGYSAYQAAKEHLADLQEQAKLVDLGNTANDTVVVTGNTYPHRQALKNLGCRWEPGIRGWIGRRSDLHGRLPCGCELKTYGQAALDSMDHAESII